MLGTAACAEIDGNKPAMKIKTIERVTVDRPRCCGRAKNINQNLSAGLLRASEDALQKEDSEKVPEFGGTRLLPEGVTPTFKSRRASYPQGRAALQFSLQ